MATAAHDVREARLTSLSEADVRDALRQHNPGVPDGKVREMARVIATISDVVTQLPEARRTELTRSKTRFRNALLQVSDGSATVRHAKRDDRTAEVVDGSGLGELVGMEEGRAALDRYAVARPLEAWAGPVAGAGEIEEQLGIPRSTLNTWQKRGAVVGLLRGERKLAYPLEQFVDARPLSGVADILAIAPDTRAAWLWMRQPHGALEGCSPLQELRDGRRNEALRAAERDFA